MPAGRSSRTGLPPSASNCATTFRRQGFAATIRNRTVLALATETLKLSRGGLARRARLNPGGQDETYYLEPLDDLVSRGTTPAEELLVKFNGPWGGSVDPIFTEYAYYDGQGHTRDGRAAESRRRLHAARIRLRPRCRQHRHAGGGKRSASIRRACSKTLMAKAGSDVVCVLAPSDKDVSLKKLAAAAGAKDAAMLKPAEAERITGYRVGGISPFGQKKRARVFIEAAAMTHATVIVNGGRRGLQIELPPAELVRLLERETGGDCALTRARFTALDFSLYAADRVRLGIFLDRHLHYQVGTVPPEVSVMWRFAIAAPVDARASRPRAANGSSIRSRDHARFLALGLALFCTNFLLFYYGGLYLASGLLAVVFSLASIINIFLGALVLRHAGRPARRRRRHARLPRHRRDVLSATCGHHDQYRGADRACLWRRRHLVLLHRQHDLRAHATARHPGLRGQRLRHALWRDRDGAVRASCAGILSRSTGRRLISRPGLSRADRLGDGVRLLSHVARPHRRRPRRLCHRDVSGGRARGLDLRRGLSLDVARVIGLVAVLAGNLLVLRTPKKS